MLHKLNLEAVSSNVSLIDNNKTFGEFYKNTEDLSPKAYSKRDFLPKVKSNKNTVNLNNTTNKSFGLDESIEEQQLKESSSQPRMYIKFNIKIV